MSTQARRLALIGGLAVVAFLIAWLSSGGADRSGDESARKLATPTPPAELPSFGAEGQQTPESLAQPSAEPTIVATQTVAATSSDARLLVRVTWPDKSPAVDVGLKVYPGGRALPWDNALVGRTDAKGEWSLQPAPLGQIGVLTDRGGQAFGDILAGGLTQLEIEIPPGARVRGLVVDQAGRAAPGAEIWLSDQTNPNMGSIVARCGEDGRFELRDVSGERWIAARAEGLVPSPLEPLHRDGPPEVELRLQLGGAAAELRGLVLESTGAPAVGAHVRVGPDDGWRNPDATHKYGARSQDLLTDAEGRFVAKALPPGVIQIQVRHAGSTPCDQYFEAAAGVPTDVRIHLEPGATLEGTARDEAGAPLADVLVAVGQSPAQMIYTSCKSDETGHYVLRDPPLHEQLVKASLKNKGKAETTLAFAPGKTLGWDPVISLGWQILGRVTDEAGGSVEGLQVSVMHEGPDNWFVGAKVAADGRFTIPNCENVAHRIEVYGPRGEKPCLGVATGVMPGPQDVWVTIPAGARQSAAIVGRLVDARGGTPSGLRIYVSTPGSRMLDTGTLDAATGAFSVDKLRAGDHELRVVQGDGQRQMKLLSTPVLGLLPNERRDLGTLVLASPGRIVLRATLPPGAIDFVYAGLEAEAGGSGGEFDRTSKDPPAWTSGPLMPGNYEVSLGPGSGGEEAIFIVPVSVPARVEAGRDTEVQITAERGVGLNVHLTTTRTPPPETTVRATDAAGVPLRIQTPYWDSNHDATASEAWVSFICRPGAYTLRVEAAGQLVTERSLALPGGVNIAPQVEVEVP